MHVVRLLQPHAAFLAVILARCALLTPCASGVASMGKRLIAVMLDRGGMRMQAGQRVRPARLSCGRVAAAAAAAAAGLRDAGSPSHSIGFSAALCCGCVTGALSAVVEVCQ